MNLSADYFRIAREEEKSDQPEAALLHYISSLLSGPALASCPIKLQRKSGVFRRGCFCRMNNFCPMFIHMVSSLILTAGNCFAFLSLAIS